MVAVEKRGESSYGLTVSCGYDKQGKKLVKRKTIDLSYIKPNKREDEASRQWILFKDEVEKGIFLDAGKITFEDFIGRSLKDYAEHELAPKTLHRYKELLNTRIIPALGHIKLSQLQPIHLTEFYNNLREKGIRLDNKYAPKENFSEIISSLGYTQKDIIKQSGINERTIKSICHGNNAQASTVNKICEAIKVERKEARHFDEDQIDYIFELLKDEPIKYRAMITLSIYGDMRMGELVGLHWSDVDLDNKVLKIRQSSQYLPGEGVFTKDTKNFSSHRFISLPKTAIKVMNEYKLWQNGEKAKPGNL